VWNSCALSASAQQARWHQAARMPFNIDEIAMLDGIVARRDYKEPEKRIYHFDSVCSVFIENA
jgi:hypothetical protein